LVSRLREQVLAAGRGEFDAKPINFEHLLLTINTVLANRSIHAPSLARRQSGDAWAKRSPRLWRLNCAAYRFWPKTDISDPMFT
jgi:hypothetical protein